MPTDAAGQAFLAQKAREPGVISRPSGLLYEYIERGSGNSNPLPDTPCDFHYKGTLINGEEFDSSYKRGKPSEFTANGVVPGCTEGYQLMVEGDKVMLYIPAELAYGDQGVGDGLVPPGAVLVFEVYLVKIKGPSKPTGRQDASQPQVSAQPQAYAQLQAYAQSQAYAQPQAYTQQQQQQPQAYAQQAYVHPQVYAQPQASVQPQAYAQPQSYTQPQAYTQQQQPRANMQQVAQAPQIYARPQAYAQPQAYMQQQPQAYMQQPQAYMQQQPQAYGQPQGFAPQMMQGFRGF